MMSLFSFFLSGVNVFESRTANEYSEKGCLRGFETFFNVSVI